MIEVCLWLVACAAAEQAEDDGDADDADGLGAAFFLLSQTVAAPPSASRAVKTRPALPEVVADGGGGAAVAVAAAAAAAASVRMLSHWNLPSMGRSFSKS